MQIKDVRPESFVKQIRCDRCDRLADMSEAEFQEFVSIDLTVGYASIFGDGEDVQIDLCQHCLKSLLGPCLRIASAEKADDLPQDGSEFLSSGAKASDDSMSDMLPKRFDRERQGGEFPTAADVSLQEPDSMPVQERMPLNVPSAMHLRLAALRAFFGYSVRLFFAPLTGAVRGIRREYRRLERIERERRRRHAEFVRRGQEAIKRAEAKGDWIPAEAVIERLRVKVAAARERRSSE